MDFLIPKLRDELLNQAIFTTLTEVKILIEQWRWKYNHVRLHSALRYRPPVPEAILTAVTIQEVVPLMGTGQLNMGISGKQKNTTTGDVS